MAAVILPTGGTAVIDGRRVRSRLEALAQIGRDPAGGVTRLSFSEDDRRARELFGRWCGEAGLRLRTDAAGNLIARLDGYRPGVPAIAAGSHLDTVPRGGAFDGTLGCVGALECAQSLAAEGRRLAHPLEVLVFVEEEGTRFGSGLLGSRAMAGLLGLSELEQSRDAEGISAAQAMERFGLQPRRLDAAARRAGELAAYLELHVEQGPLLEYAGVGIGIVTEIVGIWRYTLRLLGQANHAGTTRLPMRRDALLAAARVIVAARRLTAERGTEASVATVGQIAVEPGAVNVVPGRAELVLEVRDADEARLSEIAGAILAEAARIADEERVELEVQEGVRIAPVPMHAAARHAVRRAAEQLGIAVRELPSGAGHDAQSMAGLCPAGMIFVPSAGGLSHCPAESTPWEQVEAGVRVLERTICILDRGGSDER